MSPATLRVTYIHTYVSITRVHAYAQGEFWALMLLNESEARDSIVKSIALVGSGAVRYARVHCWLVQARVERISLEKLSARQVESLHMKAAAGVFQVLPLWGVTSEPCTEGMIAAAEAFRQPPERRNVWQVLQRKTKQQSTAKILMERAASKRKAEDRV